MQIEQTITLTVEEVRRAIGEYIERVTDKKVKAVDISSDGFRSVVCVVQCEPPFTLDEDCPSRFEDDPS